MVDWGIKITKPGTGVTSTNVRDYQIWSKYPIMKTYLVGTASYTFTSDIDFVDIQITHNLGPPRLAWFNFDGSAMNSQWKGSDFWAYFYNSGGNTASRFWTLHSDVDRIRLQYEEGNQAGSGYNPTGEVWQFKYYIFIEQRA